MSTENDNTFFDLLGEYKSVTPKRGAGFHKKTSVRQRRKFILWHLIPYPLILSHTFMQKAIKIVLVILSPVIVIAAISWIGGSVLAFWHSLFTGEVLFFFLFWFAAALFMTAWGWLWDGAGKLISMAFKKG